MPPRRRRNHRARSSSAAMRAGSGGRSGSPRSRARRHARRRSAARPLWKHGRRSAWKIPFEFDSPPRQLARCTSAARGRHCTTGSPPGGRGGRWSCGSRTPTASVRRRRTSSRSSTRSDGSSSTGTRGRSASTSGPRHRERLEELLESGSAYHDATTGAEVQEWQGEPGPGTAASRTGAAAAGAAIRLRVPDEGETVVPDAIRGEISFRNDLQDDPVIARADGSVLYNFAVAVDDADMGITDVIRGDDHLSNTPRQLLVLEALGEAPPRYAHLPLLHGPDGKKLSKRHGAASVQELAKPASCRRPSATTWRCSAGAPRTTRRSSRPRSSSAVSRSTGSAGRRRSSTRGSCAG